MVLKKNDIIITPQFKLVVVSVFENNRFKSLWPGFFFLSPATFIFDQDTNCIKYTDGVVLGDVKEIKEGEGQDQVERHEQYKDLLADVEERHGAKPKVSESYDATDASFIHSAISDKNGPPAVTRMMAGLKAIGVVVTPDQAKAIDDGLKMVIRNISQGSMTAIVSGSVPMLDFGE